MYTAVVTRLVLLLACVLVAVSGVAARAADPARAARARASGPGADRQALRGADPEGATLTLADFRGRVVLLNFWATWCGPCKEEMPAMERLYQRFREQGLVVLAVSNDSEGSTRSVARFTKESGFTFPVGLDPRLRVASLYGVRVLPASLIIDRKGSIPTSRWGRGNGIVRPRASSSSLS